MTFLETIQIDFIDILPFYNRPFRSKFIPAKVWLDLDNYKNNPIKLMQYCRKWRTKIEWKQSFSKSRNSKNIDSPLYIGGEYISENRQCIIQIYTQQFELSKFTTKSWDKFKFRLIQTIMHEFVHFMQYDRRNDEPSNYVVSYKKIGEAKVDSERSYLSEFDEIQAYAHCSYLDLKTKKPNVSLDFLLNNCKTRKDSSTLHYFLKTFDYDFKNNMATKKIISQIGKWDRKYNKALGR